MGREVLKSTPQFYYNRIMPGILAKAVLLTVALIVVTSANAQTRRHRAPKEVERATPAPPVPVDKRDSYGAAAGRIQRQAVLAGAGANAAAPILSSISSYADAAAHARVIKPDPKATADYTKELKEAIKTATVYFDATERFLMNDRGIERVDAVLTYDPQSRAAGDRLKTVDAALAAAQACPALYHACQGAYPKVCSESLSPTS